MTISISTQVRKVVRSAGLREQLRYLPGRQRSAAFMRFPRQRRVRHWGTRESAESKRAQCMRLLGSVILLSMLASAAIADPKTEPRYGAKASRSDVLPRPTKQKSWADEVIEATIGARNAVSRGLFGGASADNRPGSGGARSSSDHGGSSGHASAASEGRTASGEGAHRGSEARGGDHGRGSNGNGGHGNSGAGNGGHGNGGSRGDHR